MNISITKASNDRNKFIYLFTRVYLLVRCCTRLMNVEAYESAKELAEATVKDLQTSNMNVNKMFENNSASTRI